MKVVNLNLDLDKLNLITGCLQIHSVTVANLMRDIQAQASDQVADKPEVKEPEDAS